MLDTREEPVHLLLSQLSIRGSGIISPFLRIMKNEGFGIIGQFWNPQPEASRITGLSTINEFWNS